MQKQNVVSTKKDINHLLRDEAVLEEEKKEELSKSAEEVLSQGFGGTGSTGNTALGIQEAQVQVALQVQLVTLAQQDWG